MLTELFELTFPDFNDTDILAFHSAWHFNHIICGYQSEDTVFTTTLYTMKLFIEMG